jgi:hypothetical protein
MAGGGTSWNSGGGTSDLAANLYIDDLQAQIVNESDT